MALNWKFFGEGNLGPLKFLKNGDLEVGGMRFDKTCELDNCTIGADGTTLDFSGSSATVKAPNETHCFRFIEGRGWEYARSGEGSVKSAPAKARFGSALLWTLGFIVVFVVVACVLGK